MSHIHTDPGQHDATICAYIVRLDLPEPALVLHMHRKLHKYLQFGGHIELHENPWQAITHEIAEESGYAMDQLKILQPEVRLESLKGAVLHPQPVTYQTHRFAAADHYHTDVSYAFVTRELPRSAVADGESAELRTFTLSELAALPDEDIPANVRQTSIYILTVVLANWHQVNTADFAL